MASQEFLATPRTPPDLHVPKSSNTVTVRIIDTTSTITLNPHILFGPPIPPGSSEYTANIPSFAFLISHPSGRHILFDLGVWPPHLTPGMRSRMEKMGFKASADKHVAQILDEAKARGEVGVGGEDVEGVVWSHQHFDHTGDISAFPPSTSLIVGPGFKAAHLPGYPQNPDSALQNSDFEGREVHEATMNTCINFTGSTHRPSRSPDPASTSAPKEGEANAHDYFGDGSFYLLDTPGHTVGHVSGLARVTTNPDTFVLMGGDACHHPGELRPSLFLPLPTSITPSPLPTQYAATCPGSLFRGIRPHDIHPSHNDYPDSEASANSPFYAPTPTSCASHPQALQSIGKLMELEAPGKVLTVLAHDETLLGRVPVFPESVNGWFEGGLGKEVRWRFLGEFEEAVGGGEKAKV